MDKNRKILFLVVMFMTLGSGMYGIFLPNYFLSIGFSYEQVIFACAVFYIGGILAGIFANNLMRLFSVKIYYVLRGIIEPIFIILVRNYSNFNVPIWLLMAMSGIISLGFWITMDVITIYSTDKKKRGIQQVNIFSGLWIAVLVSPFLGGLIIRNFGYSVMFLIALLFLIIGGIISFFLKFEFKISKKWNLIPELKNDIGKHMLIIYLRGFGFGSLGFLVPIVLFRLIQDEFLLGVYGLIFGAGALIATIVSGKLIDKLPKKKLLVLILFLSGFSWIIANLNVEIIIVLVYFLFHASNIPLGTMFFDLIEKKDIVGLNAQRMMCLSAGGLTAMLAALFLPVISVFTITGVSILLGSFVASRLA